MRKYLTLISMLIFSMTVFADGSGQVLASALAAVKNIGAKVVAFSAHRDVTVNDASFSLALERKVGQLLLEGEFARELKNYRFNRANGILQGILDRLIENSSKLKQYNPRVFISDSDVPQAYALPGGYIICTIGIIKEAQSLEEIAGILAHELGHIESGHAAQQMLASLGTTGLSLMAFLVFGRDDQRRMAMALSEVLRLGYSRLQEEEADRCAVDLLLNSNISPKGLIKFFERLETSEARSHNSGRTMLSTHPLIGNRIKSIETQIGRHPEMAFQTIPGSLAELKNL